MFCDRSKGILAFEDFCRIRDLLCKRIGIYFDDRKLPFIETRIWGRMKAIGIHSSLEYVNALRFNDPGNAEFQKLVDAVTTNETYMFREYDQLEAFANFCLPEMLKRKKERADKTIRIWSAGCSSGEEPYTLAIIMREVLEEPADWNVQIIASDIDQGMLEKTNRAFYEQRAVKDVPDAYMEKHLIPEGKGWTVHPDTKRLVRVMQINLNDRVEVRAMEGMDFIFCRNVLIYFNEISRAEAVAGFFHCLNRSGFLFLGHSESVGRINTAFQLRRLGQHLVYGKP